MKYLHKLLLGATIMCSVALSGSAGFSQTKTVPNKVLAVVNGHKITTREVKLASEDLYLTLQKIPPTFRNAYVVQYLIERRLLAQQAIREGLGTSSEYNTRLVFYQAKALRDAYFIRKLEAGVTEDVVRAAYDKEAKAITGVDRFRARHILVATEQEAMEIAKKLKAGDHFEALAKAYSLDGSKDFGGDLGYFTAGEMVKEFSAAVMKLKKGEITPPVKTEFGWHIIRLEDKKGGPRAYTKVKVPIRAVLLRKAVQDKIAELTKTAKIEMVDPDLKNQLKETLRKNKELQELEGKRLKQKSGKSDPAGN